MRHRYFLALPFLLLFFGTLIGGQLNTVDAQGVVVAQTIHDGVHQTFGGSGKP